MLTNKVQFAIDDTAYFFDDPDRFVLLRTTTSIAKGEELTVNWGSGWFGSDCPCLDCIVPGPVLTAAPHPPAPGPPPPPMHASIRKREELLSKLRAAIKLSKGQGET